MMRIPYSCINSSDALDHSPVGLGIYTYIRNDQNASSSHARGGLANNTEPEEYRKFYLQAQFATGLILYPIICLFGLCGNCLSIAVLSLKKMRTPTNIYLTSLAIADSIKLVNDMLYFASILAMRTNPPLGRSMYAYLYPYAHYFFHMSVFCSAWLTVSVAVERYILICHPTRGKVICSFTTAKVVCCLVFVSTSLLTIPLSLRYQSIKVFNQCEGRELLEVTVSALWRDKTFSTAYTWLHNSLRTVLPIICVTILNYFIVRSLRESRRRRRNITSLHRITVMLVSVIVVFVVCVTPDAVISTIFGYGYYEANYLVRAVREVTDLLLLINSAANFILYCTFNYVFRKNFMAIFCTLDPHRSRVFKRDVTAHISSVPSSLLNKSKKYIVGGENKPVHNNHVSTLPNKVDGDQGDEKVDNNGEDPQRGIINGDIKACVEETPYLNENSSDCCAELEQEASDIMGDSTQNNGTEKPNEILVNVQMDRTERDENYHESSL